LIDMIGRQTEAATRHGSVRGELIGGNVDFGVERKWTRFPGDQSNTLALLNDRHVLKLFRRVEPGPNPEFEITRFLSQRGFRHTPALAGALSYARSGVEPGALAVVQAAVRHQGTGWEFSINELRRYYERVSARMQPAEGQEGQDGRDGQDALVPPPFFAALESWYLANATTLGRRTGELHLALASGRDPDFAPEPLAGGPLRELADQLRSHAAGVLDLLQTRLDMLGETARPQAETVLAARHAILDRFEAIRELDKPGLRIRVHGDYHLGQVLRVEEDFAILDFEGEPSRTLAERRAKQSPIKDLAGMVRSFSYAAYAALLAFTLNAPDEYAPLERWADEWQHWASDAFLTGYLSMLEDKAHGSTIPSRPAFLPDRGTFSLLLSAFVLDKALYELSYELNHRPEWVRIPIIGILKEI
jgi:maltose alpha-D-glucosyltransferase/alpha-amylase